MTAQEITRRAMDRGAAQKHPELEWLVKIVADRCPRSVVEIGTMDGGTLSAWCECARRDAVIVSVDLPGGEWGGGYDGPRANTIRTFAGSKQRLELVPSDSHAPETREAVQELLGGRGIDFLFIDGDHSYEGVRDDFLDYAPLVVPGGLIALHDVALHPQVPGCQVSRFWGELKAKYGPAARTLYVDGHERGWGPWGGIGVLERGDEL